MNVRMNGPGRARAVARVALAAATALVLVAGCTRGSQSYERQASQAQRRSPDERPWFCNSVGDGTPITGHGNGSHVHPLYEDRTKGPLSWEDCKALARQLDQTLKAVKHLDTKAKGEAAGWRELASYIPGLGTHHGKLPAGAVPPGSIPGGPGGPGGSVPGRDIGALTRCLQEQGVDTTAGPPDFTDPAVAAALRACGVTLPDPSSFPGFGQFDPANPQFLIYGGPNPDSPLVGVAYAFFGGDEPPEAYAGGNDWWHLHTKVCVGPDRQVLAGAEEISDEECTRLGGTNRSLARLPGSTGMGSGIWLLHVWMVPGYEYRPDIFVSGHPCLVEDGPAPKADPCWEIARRDPSLGPPPRPEGGDDGHGGDGHGGDGHGGDGHGPEPGPDTPVTDTPTTTPAPTTPAPTAPAPTSPPTTAAPGGDGGGSHGHDPGAGGHGHGH